MLKPESLLYSILGPIRSDIRPLACAIEAAEQLLFVRHFPIDDIKVTKHIYPYVAGQIRKSPCAAAKAVERLSPLCWDALVLKNLLSVYIGDDSMQMPPPGTLVIYLAVYAHFELPFSLAVKQYPDILFPLDADGHTADMEVIEALRRAQPLPVVRRMAFLSSDGYSLFPICPACNCTFDRDFQAYCDHCGQCLDWSHYEDAHIIFHDKPPVLT